MTELVFILDRSGSMAGLEADTIGGFNSMIAKQKKEAARRLSPRSCLTATAPSFTTGCRWRRCRP